MAWSCIGGNPFTHLGLKSNICIVKNSSYFISDAYMNHKSLYFSDSHDDVIKWNHFPRYWPFVGGIHQSPVTGEFSAQRPVTGSFDVFFHLRLNKRLSKQS